MNPNLKKIIVPAIVVAFALFAYLALDKPSATTGPLAGRGPVAAPVPGKDAVRPFGETVTLEVGGSARFEDGMTLRLDGIDDSRCAPGVVCIWQGELSATVAVTKDGTETVARLGQATAPGVNAGGYALTLVGITETSVAVSVLKTAAPTATGDARLRLSMPVAGQLVKSPMAVAGEARGTWYFEASFPVRLLDEDGTELAAAPAQALGEWMTEDFVPFALNLPFPAPKGKVGTLVLMRDNPSGLPENDAEVRIPVRFAP
jgi:hypothetical protein